MTIRERRKALGLTQRELATALGVTRWTIMRWESGKTTCPYPRMLSLALNAISRHTEARTAQS